MSTHADTENKFRAEQYVRMSAVLKKNLQVFQKAVHPGLLSELSKLNENFVML
jgi:hypothetical protein